MRIPIGLLALLFAAAPAQASDWIANTTAPASVRADARGDAEVDWSGQSLVVPPTGNVFHGRLPGTDVSKRAAAPGVPNVVSVGRTPNGTLFALQRWQVADHPAELHLARWQGASTKLTLTLTGPGLTGAVTFQGRPVTGISPTPSGKQVRIYVFIDCLGCPAAPNGWSPMLGVAPRADGTFAVRLRPSWQGRRYRASVAGPNRGSTLAPDAQAFAGS